MSVYYKFRSLKFLDSIPIDGPYISVANLRSMIVAKKKLENDFLVIQNSQSGELYSDMDALIPRYTSVVVRRIPRPWPPLVVPLRAPLLTEASQNDDPQKLPEKRIIDELCDEQFGDDVYTVTEAVSLADKDDEVQSEVDKREEMPGSAKSYSKAVPISDKDEDIRIRAFLDAASDWRSQEKEMSYSNRRRAMPHEGYVCHRCQIAGHFIKDCPTNGDPAFDKKKIKKPSGIPKTMLIPDAGGTYLSPTGEIMQIKPNEAEFEREMANVPSSLSMLSGAQKMDIPPELCCELCKRVLRDAVLCSKCCFKSFCYDCIRDQIISRQECTCGARNVLVDDLLPNKTLRDTVRRRLESMQASQSTSTEMTSTITSTDSAASRVFKKQKYY